MTDGRARPRDPWIPGERLAGERASFDAGPGAPVVGVLALQGDVLEHLRILRGLAVTGRRVRRAEDLDGVDAIIIPGGESTTIGRLLTRFELLEPLADRIRAGLPTFGTCAGMILLSRELEQDRSQPLLGVMGIRTRRNAFGRQVDSFDTKLAIAGIDGAPVDVSFIRAPWVEAVLDDDVEVLATVDDHPVVVRQGHMLAAAFHPEITGDDRLHALFLAAVAPA